MKNLEKELRLLKQKTGVDLNYVLIKEVIITYIEKKYSKI